MLLNTSFKAAISSVALFLLLSSCNSNEPKTKQDNITQLRNEEHDDLIQRGHYLVTAGGCNDCHTPKIMTQQGPVLDSTKILSGRPANEPLPPVDVNALKPGYWVMFAPDLTAAMGPWGISFTANLTPDSTTGIGAWSEEVFIKTLRTGKHLGQENGRPILPPMPWYDIAKLKDEDLKAIYAYLRSIPPINNRVPAPLSPQEAVALAKNNKSTFASKAE